MVLLSVQRRRCVASLISSGSFANVPARTPRAGRPLRLTRVVWQGGARGTFATRSRRTACAMSLGRGGLHIPRQTQRAPQRRERQRPGGGCFPFFLLKGAITPTRASCWLRGCGVPTLSSHCESAFPLVRAGKTTLVVYGALVRAGVSCCCWVVRLLLGCGLGYARACAAVVVLCLDCCGGC